MTHRAVVAGAVSALMLAGCQAAATSTPTPVVTAPPPSLDLAHLTAGMPTKVGDLTYTVNGIAEGVSNNPSNSPNDGNVFWFLDVSVTNTSSDSQQYGDNWSIQDSGGFLHTGDPSAKDPNFNGTVQPGQTVRGYITFQTAIGLKPATAIFQTNAFGGSNISIAFTAGAVATAPPPPANLTTGVPIVVGDLTYTVNGIAQGASNNQFTQPNDGNLFWFLDVIVKNTSNSSLPYGDGWSIQDSAGGLHTGDPSVQDPNFNGTLPGGQSTRGYITFQTPVGQKPVTAILQTTAFGGSSISVALHVTNVGLATAPPATPATTAAPVVTAPPAVAAKTLLSVSGSGIKTTKSFNASGDSVDVHYTFNCSNFGQAGNFQIYFFGANALGDTVPDILANAIATKGSDTSTEYLSGATGPFHIEVNSECSWTVKVLGTP